MTQPLEDVIGRLLAVNITEVRYYVALVGKDIPLVEGEELLSRISVYYEAILALEYTPEEYLKATEHLIK